MNRLCYLFAGLLFGAYIFPAELLAQVNAKPPKESVAESKTLFNGTDLAGWEGDSRLWSVRDGAIHGETTDENKTNGNTFLIWKNGVVRDFVLRLTFRCNATNNSGIQYRSKHFIDEDAPNNWVVRGYQHEIRNQNKLPDVSGFIYDEGGRRGRLCLVGERTEWTREGKHVFETFLKEQDFQKIFKLDDWNDVVIVAKGNRIQHFMNSHLILDFIDNDPKLASSEGIVALQLHAGKPMWAEFKNIRLIELK